MSTLKKLLKKLPALAFYAVFLALILLRQTGLLLWDRLTMPPPQTLTAEDFELIDLAPLEDGGYVALSADPQMLLDGAGVRTVAYALRQGGSATVCAYYTTRPGEDFSDRRRLWPPYGQTQRALYMFPRGGVDRVRLDVTSVAYDVLEFEYLTLNAPVPWARYFTPDAMGIALFLTLPGLCWLFCDFLRQTWPWRRRS